MATMTLEDVMRLVDDHRREYARLAPGIRDVIEAALRPVYAKAALAEELALRLRQLRDNGTGIGIATVLDAYDALKEPEVKA